MGVQQAARHHRGAHGNAGGDRRPQQRHGVALQLFLAADAQALVDRRRLGGQGGFPAPVLFVVAFFVLVPVVVAGLVALPFDGFFPGRVVLVVIPRILIVVRQRGSPGGK